MQNKTAIIVFMIFASLFFLEATRVSKPHSQRFLFKDIKFNNLILPENLPDHFPKKLPLKPNQDLINNVLAYASIYNNIPVELTGFCNKNEYTYATLDEQRLRILKLYTNLALKQLNQRCKKFAILSMLQPFHFVFIEIINATSSINKYGNSNWRVDLMVEETSLHLSSRLILDFSVEINPLSDGSTVLTCAEYTTFPFPKYFIGYPTMDQMIPLPTQVISTGPGIVLSQGGTVSNYPDFKNLYLNKVWMENSDLALGTELPETLFCSTAPAVNDTNLPSSKYPSKRFVRNDVQFPEKFYADCLEKNKSTDTDIIDNDTWKPDNYKCTGTPENKYHYTGSSETYNQSMVKPSWPNGWIQPAKWRNKWPRLWSEPRDRYEYPSVPAAYMWNNLGIMYPSKQNSKNNGIRWSTEQAPRIPNYWPTITGLPSSGGPNYWLFNKTRGFNANLPHGGFT
jgi:hypothetical protein